MKTTKITATIGAATIAVVTVAMAITHQSAAVKESYFNANIRQLRQAPKNLVVLRRTRFSECYAKISGDYENGSLTRLVGRDVPLRQTIAEAYDCAPAQVLLPPDAAQKRFDFLVTTSTDVRAHLQAAIQKDLHYVAHRKTLNTDVFILKVTNPALPGLAVSVAGESRGIAYRNGRLFFTREPVSAILGGLSQGLNKPILDETELTNHYDFSVPWNGKAQNEMENGGFNLAGAQKVLAGWGLVLEPTNIPMDMYVVTAHGP